jgi:hypothetical protein
MLNEIASVNWANWGPPLMPRNVVPSIVNSPAITLPGVPWPNAVYRVRWPIEEFGKIDV